MNEQPPVAAESPRLAPESPLWELAAFVSHCAIGEIPEPVLEHARGLILDQLGVALIGSRQAAYRELTGATTGMGLHHDGPALVLAGQAPRRSPYAAALLNAAAAHLSELGEGVSRAVVHVSNAVVPAALAHADARPVTGEELLRAVAMGCEALIRFGMAVNTPPGGTGGQGDLAAAYLRGWWTPIVLAPVGAATAWSLLGRGGPGVVAEAWLTALSCAPAACVPFILGGGSTKGLGMGLGCASGVAAAEVALAQHPGAGQGAGYDPVSGWMPLIVPEVNRDALVDGLGERWELDYPLYKYIATVGPLHAALEAIFEILDRQPIRHQDVTEILVEGYQRTVQFLGRPRPRTAEAAKTSLCHVLAAAVVTGRRDVLLHEAFEPEVRADDDVARVAATVRAVRDPERDAEYPRRSARARVTITLTNGDAHVAEVDRDALARYHRPSRTDLTDKFVAATGHLLNEPDARRLAARVWSIERLPRAGEVTDSLASLLTRADPQRGSTT